MDWLMVEQGNAGDKKTLHVVEWDAKGRRGMPVTVQKKGSKWKIVDKSSGRVVGTSDSKEKAEASARMRNMAYKEKMMKRRNEVHPMAPVAMND